MRRDRHDAQFDQRRHRQNRDQKVNAGGRHAHAQHDADDRRQQQQRRQAAGADLDQQESQAEGQAGVFKDADNQPGAGADENDLDRGS